MDETVQRPAKSFLAIMVFPGCIRLTEDDTCPNESVTVGMLPAFTVQVILQSKASYLLHQAQPWVFFQRFVVKSEAVVFLMRSRSLGHESDETTACGM